MTSRTEFMADLIAQVQAVTPEDQLVLALSELIGAAAATMRICIGKDETVGTLARMVIAINEGRMPEPRRPN